MIQPIGARQVLGSYQAGGTRPQQGVQEPVDAYLPSDRPIRLERPGVLARSATALSGTARSLVTFIVGAPLLAGLAPLGVLGALKAGAGKLLFGGSFLNRLENQPTAFEQLSRVGLNLASAPIEKAFGLSVPDLLEAELHLFRLMAPHREGEKVIPCGLFEQFMQDGNRPLVYLGDAPHQQQAALWLEEQALGADATELPAGLSPARAAQALEALGAQKERGEAQVFVDLDGDFGSTTATEGILRSTLSSLFPADWNSEEHARYFGWLNSRLLGYSEVLAPWLKARRPEAYRDMQEIKRLMDPPWREGKSAVLGWRIPPKDAARASSLLQRDSDPDTFTDLVVSLDRDLVSGAQSYWVKLLREMSPEQRREVLTRMARVWSHYQATPGIGPERMRDALLGKEAPLTFPELDRVTGRYQVVAYDRPEALTDLVDRTLNGLGLEERSEFLELLRKELNQREPELAARDLRLKSQWNYSGLRVAPLVGGYARPDEPSVLRAIGELREVEKQLSPGISADWQLRAAEVTRHRSLLEWLHTLPHRYQDPSFRMTPEPGRLLAVSEFFPKIEVRPATRDVERRSLVLGQPDGRPPLPTSLVLEGGGGKGFAYPQVLSSLEAALADKPGQVAIDEFVGTSAGALTAGLLAAGFQGEELKGTMASLNFMEFNSDFFQLQSASDPEVRGIERTGLFTMRTMYETMYGLMSDKLGIKGRPITFRDLPHGLKVCSVVLSTDLPVDHPLRKHIGRDGQIVFSRETTPDFDVVGCMVASAAVPLYFNSPQLHLAEGAGNQIATYRMQFLDGGVTNNLPLDQAGLPGEQACALVLPVTHEGLSTLSFDAGQSGPVDRRNAQYYEKTLTNLNPFLNRIKEKGYGRLVLGLNLCRPEDQPAPVVQGRTRAESRDLVDEACGLGLPCMDARDGASIVASNLPRRTVKSTLVGQFVADALVDGNGSQDRFRSDWLSRRYAIAAREAGGIGDILSATLGAGLTAEHQGKLFEG